MTRPYHSFLFGVSGKSLAMIGDGFETKMLHQAATFGDFRKVPKDQFGGRDVVRGKETLRTVLKFRRNLIGVHRFVRCSEGMLYACL